VESAQDVLEELQLVPSAAPPGDAAEGAPPGTLDDSQTLLRALGFDPVGLDALQARCEIDTATLQAQLMALELDGHVARLPGGLFQRVVAT
jgi:DNA processing protein